MKINVLICVLFMCQIVTSKLIAQSYKNIDSKIECLNQKIVSYNIGVTLLKGTNKIDTIIAQIDTIHKISIRSFEAKSNYNKLGLKLKVDYYYSSDLSTIIKLENKLLETHNLEIKKFDTEFIVRIENLVVSINIDKKFEGSFLYLKSIIFQLLLDYINQCKN